MTKKCNAAYHGISINHNGTLDPCCQFHADTRVKPISFTQFDVYQNTVQRRLHQDAEADVEHPGCNKCWREEESGWSSLRQSFNKLYPTDDNITVSSKNQIKHIELRLGNLCNLNCIMCWPGASSSIGTERQQHQEKFQAIGMDTKIVPLNYYWETPEFLEFSKKLFKDADVVNITGGEPFMIPEVLNILDDLMLRKDQVKISFNTNLTRLNNKIIDRLKEFKNLNIVISLEGVGVKNDYLRYPSKWSEIVNNISLLREQVPQAFLSINHTFQHTSIYAFPELWNFCFVNDIMLHRTSVQGNPILTLDSVPPDDIEKFREWLEHNPYIKNNDYDQLNKFISTATFDPILNKKFYAYVDVLDEIRGTNFYQIFNPTKIA